MEAIIPIAGFLAVMAVFIVATVRHQKRRVEEHRQHAAQTGWGFQEKVPFSGIPGLDRFELFRQGRSRRLQNIATSPAGDPRLVLFDYLYTTGAGKSRRVHRQTVCYVTGDALDLPAFSLRPERFFHRIAALLGHDDIDLDQHPDFSRAFLLRGGDEAAVRHAFHADVVAFFDARPGTCAAGSGHELLFWRPGRVLRPAQREELVAETLELTGRFAGRSARS